MNSLLDVGAMDDDQFLLLMVYKKYPSLVNIQYGYWFTVFERNSDQHFTIRHIPVPSIPRRAVNKLKRITTKLYKRMTLSSFVKRMQQAEKRHYD